MNEWTTIITAKRKWYDFNLKELIEYKDLIYMFVKRNFTSQYKQTILGPMWFIINPLITSFISTIVFGGIAGIESDGVPYFLFYLCGFTLWNYFATCVNQTSATFTANSGIMGKVYFPRLAMPISSVIYAALNMFVVLCLTIISAIIYYFKGADIHMGIGVLLLPILIIQTAALGLGVGIIISSLTTKYRDLAVLTGFGVNLWMYITPVVYPLSKVPEKIKWVVLINPMTSIVNNMRYAMLGVGDLEIFWWFISLIITSLLLTIGILIFNRIEKTFMDTV